jgi:hypothetical protein
MDSTGRTRSRRSASSDRGVALEKRDRSLMANVRCVRSGAWGLGPSRLSVPFTTRHPMEHRSSRPLAQICAALSFPCPTVAAVPTVDAVVVSNPYSPANTMMYEVTARVSDHAADSDHVGTVGFAPSGTNCATGTSTTGARGAVRDDPLSDVDALQLPAGRGVRLQRAGGIRVHRGDEVRPPSREDSRFHTAFPRDEERSCQLCRPRR